MQKIYILLFHVWNVYFKCDIIKTFYCGFINTYIFENILQVGNFTYRETTYLKVWIGVWVLKVTFRQTACIWSNRDLFWCGMAFISTFKICQLYMLWLRNFLGEESLHRYKVTFNNFQLSWGPKLLQEESPVNPL